jgi:hypothetical protein
VVSLMVVSLEVLVVACTAQLLASTNYSPEACMEQPIIL